MSWYSRLRRIGSTSVRAGLLGGQMSDQLSKVKLQGWSRAVNPVDRSEFSRTRMMAGMTRARLRFPDGDPIEVVLEDVLEYGPPVPGFRAWLGAVFASATGRWIIRFADDEILGLRRDELKRIRVTADGAELTLGERTIAVRQADVRSYAPEPEGVRAWLGRLAHGSGDAWIRLSDGRELRFAIGNGPHVSFVEPVDAPKPS